MGKTRRPDVLNRRNVFDLFWSSYPPTFRERWNRLAARCLTLLFINLSVWILAALLFKIVEGGLESSFKCGVKRVRRDFIETLWNETRTFDESDWKSSARKRLIEFENELHQAVEAGIHTYSGQTSWNLGNAFLYSFSVATTVGYSRLSPSTSTGRSLSVLFTIFANPIFFLLLLELTKLAGNSFFLAAKYWTDDSTLKTDRSTHDTDGETSSVKKESNFLKSKLKVLMSNWNASFFEGRESTSVNFDWIAMPPVLGIVLLSTWSVLTSTFYSATFLTGPVDSLFAVLTPTSTVGYVDSEHEDSLFFLLTTVNMLLGQVLYFTYLISVQDLLRKALDDVLKLVSNSDRSLKSS